jgi:hypothetical protein
MAATVFLVTLAALVAVKIAVLIGANSGLFDGLPRPTQVD